MSQKIDEIHILSQTTDSLDFEVIFAFPVRLGANLETPRSGLSSVTAGASS